jgi:hypothetical protein
MSADCVALLLIYHTSFFSDFGIYQNGSHTPSCFSVFEIESRRLYILKSRSGRRMPAGCVAFLLKYGSPVSMLWQTSKNLCLKYMFAFFSSFKLGAATCSKYISYQHMSADCSCFSAQILYSIPLELWYISKVPFVPWHVLLSSPPSKERKATTCSKATTSSQMSDYLAFLLKYCTQHFSKCGIYKNASFCMMFVCRSSFQKTPMVCRCLFFSLPPTKRTTARLCSKRIVSVPRWLEAVAVLFSAQMF